jgi:hypothetical protein
MFIVDQITEEPVADNLLLVSQELTKTILKNQ